MIDISKVHYKNIKGCEFDLAILPWGATEPHNYHLPYGTDVMLSEGVASEVARRAAANGAHCMVLPAIPFGSQNAGQAELPFCIHLSLSSQNAIVRDIVSSLMRQGINKLLIINGHGGNNFKNVTRDIMVENPSFTIVVSDWWAIIPRDGYFDEQIDEHAGEQETSVLMYLRPECVLPLSEAGDGSLVPFNAESLNKKYGWTPRLWSKVTTDTGIGNPKRSTAEKGQRYFDAVVNAITELATEFATKSLYK